MIDEIFRLLYIEEEKKNPKFLFGRLFKSVNCFETLGRE